MKLIDNTLDENMTLDENGGSIEDVRLSLEKSLLNQFQLLTLGLYSNKLLSGSVIEILDIQRIRRIFNTLFGIGWDSSEEDIANFFAQGIYERKWKIVRLSDLKNVEIRICGKFVYLWNIAEINEQLAILGSRFRFFFAGCMQIASSYVKSILAFEDKANSIDCRYIYGEIGDMSISVGGQLFEFVSEEVVSPYIEDAIPGFSMGDTAVIRDVILKKISNNDPEYYKDIWLHTYLHETLHTIGYSYKFDSPFARSNWKIFLNRDICRFLRTKHTYDEICNAFHLIIENPFLLLLEDIKPNDKSDLLNDIEPFEQVFKGLCNENVVIKDDNGMYSCSVYEGAITWSHF